MLLRGVVGSTAYGLAREGSDVDIMGVWANPSVSFWGLSQLPETKHYTKPDITYHEVGKFVRLALKANPSIIELLWLPPELYTYRSTFGDELISGRGAFLSASTVRSAYSGYARNQLGRLIRRNDEGKIGFSSDTAKRTSKHARHLFRLLHQGRQLMETGILTVEVPDPQKYWQFDDATVAEIVALFRVAQEDFDNCDSVLPDSPNVDWVENFLLRLRRASFYEDERLHPSRF